MIEELTRQYTSRHNNFLKVIEPKLEDYVRQIMDGEPRIDQLKARAKEIDSFIDKSQRKNKDGTFKYDDPLHQIFDQIGLRIVVFYRDDVDRISDKMDLYFRKINEEIKVPEKENEFSYFGKHLIMFLPDDIIDEAIKTSDDAKYFELQIVTLFQHAWSEANHDLLYKEIEELTNEEKRKVAFTSAQAWGADMIFNELFNQVMSRMRSENGGKVFIKS